MARKILSLIVFLIIIITSISASAILEIENFFASPVSISAGQVITIRMLVTNTGDAISSSTFASALTVYGTGLVSYVSGPVPASAQLNPGEGIEFTFNYASVSSGIVCYSGYAQGIDESTGNTITSAVVNSNCLNIESPASLSSFLSAIPVNVLTGGVITVIMTVTNNGEAGALNVTPSAINYSGTGSVSIISGPVPVSINLPGGASGSFTWTYSANGAGSISFNGNSSGVDENSGTIVTSMSSASNFVFITIPLTNTPTFTFTPSYTFTSNKTNTPTYTFTPSFTSTFTLTSTRTKTSTPTFTLTQTSTRTNTFTNTQTNTITATFTYTPTFGPTQCGVWVDADGVGQESMNVSNTLYSSIYPSLCIDNSGNPHIAWEDGTSGNGDIYYLKWNGSAWVDADGVGRESINISNNFGWSGDPLLKIDNSGNPHIVWNDTTTGNNEIYYLKWNGSEWVDADGVGRESINISNNGGDSLQPSLFLDDTGKPHIAWSDNTSGNGEIYYLKWNGSEWVDADGVGRESINISNNSGDSLGPSLFLDDTGKPHIAWEDNTSGNSEIYYLKWNGSEWVDADGVGRESINISNNSGYSTEPSLFLDTAENPYITWWDNTSGSWEIYFLKYLSCQGTNTPTQTPTFTPTFTSTSTRTNTSTPTFTATQTSTRTNTFTNTQTNTITATFTYTSTFSSTHTNTFTPTTTPTDSFTGDNIIYHHNAAGGNGADAGKSITQTADGKILVTGLSWDDNCTCYVSIIWKYNIDGTLDTSFGGGNGYIVCPAPSYSFVWEDGMTVKVDGSGRIYNSGYIIGCGGTCKQFVIYRYLPDGTLDTSFGGGTGYVIYSQIFGGIGEIIESDFTFDSMGRIIITGKTWNGNNYDMIVMRCNPDGTIDLSFCSGVGYRIYDYMAGNDAGVKVICDSSNNIYITGYVTITGPGCTPSCQAIAVWKFLSDGSFDPSFNSGNCFIYYDILKNHKNCKSISIVITITGEIYLTGSVDDGSGCVITCKKMIIIKLKADGTLDTTFDTDGILVNEDFPAEGVDIKLDLDGRIVVGGTRYNGINTDLIIWKYLTDGSLDTSFKGTGYSIFDSGRDEWAKNLLIYALCTYYMTGYADILGNNYDMLIWFEGCSVSPTFTPTATFTNTATFTFTSTFTGTYTETYTPSFTFTETPTFTQTITMTETHTATFTPTETFTRTATATDTYTLTNTSTHTATSTETQTPTVTFTFTPTPTQTICDGVTPPAFKVKLIYNPENSENVIIEIESSVPLSKAPIVDVYPHCNCPATNKKVLTFTAEQIPGETKKYRVLYPKQTGFGDIDKVVVKGFDICGVYGESDGSYTKETISKRDIVLYNNVINPDNNERTRIVFFIYGGGNYKISIYNRNGVFIKELFNQEIDQQSGEKEVFWDGTNSEGKKVASGIYLLVGQSPYYTKTAKIAIVR